MIRVSGVVLAAGAGRRLGTPKADVVVDGRRLVDRAVDALRGGGCDEVVAVVRVGAARTGADRDVVNPEPDRGLRSSLELGLAAAGHDGVVVLLVDTPGIGARAVRAVLEHWRRHPDRIAVGRFAGGAASAGAGAGGPGTDAHSTDAHSTGGHPTGGRGHPIVMAAARWPAAIAAAGPDEGARRYLRAHAADVDEIEVPGDASDIDDAADLRAWRQRRGRADGPGSGRVRTEPAS